MSDNSEMVDVKETPLAAVIDDSCTVEYIEITPLDRPSDDCCKAEPLFIMPDFMLEPEDLQEVIQQPADETDSVDSHYCDKVRFLCKYDKRDTCFWLKYAYILVSRLFQFLLLVYIVCSHVLH